jgi:hypothetical protein
MPPGPPCEATWEASAVFIGRVLDITDLKVDLRAPEPQLEKRLVRLSVSDTFRGTGLSIVDVATGAGDGDCGFPFRISKDYLIYAHKRDDGVLVTSICSRTEAIADAAEDLKYLRAMPPATAREGRLVGRAVQYELNPETFFVSGSAPIAGVRITAERNGRRVSGESSADGSFELRVPPGEYAMTAVAPKGSYLTYVSSPVTLIDARGCAAVGVGLLSDGTVVGSIITSDSQPVAHLPIELRTRDQWGTPFRGRTDVEGKFVIRGVSPGTYLLGIDSFEATRDLRGETPPERLLYPGTTDLAVALAISVGRAARATVPTFVLLPEWSFVTLAGTVVDADGQPVADARVSLNAGSAYGPSIGEDVSTGPDGRFNLAVRVGRTYRLVAEHVAPGPGIRRAEFTGRSTADQAIVLVMR